MRVARAVDGMGHGITTGEYPGPVGLHAPTSGEYGPAEQILVGPVLRHRDAQGRATLFVETRGHHHVRVRSCDGSDTWGGGADTWMVHGHGYALIIVSGLPDDRAVEYEVLVDDDVAWPPPDSGFPPSVIPPPPGDGPVRIAFGSCRELGPYDDDGLRAWGADALVALARRLVDEPREHWPHLILHLGDQVYADEPSPEIEELLRELHAGDPADIREEIQNFREYAWLYQTTWMHDATRWLLSTVPSAMILDDHDLRDDWNTSKTWREEMERRPWWNDRVVGALGSYWIYQHLGNLSPELLAADDLFVAVVNAPDRDATRLVDDHAWRSDVDPDTTRWSTAQDLGCIRLVIVDSRCSRVLDPPEERAIVDGVEWQWLREQVFADPPPRHLLIASTLPVFTPYGVHHVEGWSEAVATGAWGSIWSRIAERLRQGIDMEHWPAFRRSFDGMVGLLGDVVDRPEAPQTVLLLGGDVHFSYRARVALTDRDHDDTRIWQLVQSPMRNILQRSMKVVFRVLRSRGASAILRVLARSAGVTDPAVRWTFDGGLTFQNGLMIVTADRDGSSLATAVADVDDDGRERLLAKSRRRLSG